MFGKQVEAERILFDLTIAPFEPLTPGSGQNVVQRKEKLANVICPGYGCSRILRGAGFQGIVQVRSESRQAGQHDPVEAHAMSLLPLYHPRQSFSDKISKGETQPGPKGPG